MTDSIHDVINSMSEDQFSREIVVKFFLEMGFTKGDFNGGQYEFGKDVILVRPIGLDEYRIHIQSKIFKNCGGSAAKDKLIVQLHQCLNDKTFDSAGNRKPSDKVYIIAPDKIPPRLSEEIFRSIKTEDKSRFEIIEGPQLVELIKEKAPILYKELKPFNEQLTDISLLERTNHELLKAINAKHYIDLNQLYTDLSFFIGHIESKEVLQSIPFIEKKPINVDYLNWSEIRNKLKCFIKRWEFSIINESFDDLDENIKLNKNYVLGENSKSEIELPSVFITVNSKLLGDFTQKIFNVFTSLLNTFHEQQNPKTLLELLKQTSETLKFYKYINENLGFLGQIFTFDHDNSTTPELTTSPFTVFDTGLDIAVYGVAGAGKTTTLSQYAKYKLEKDSSSVIYLKLNDLYSKYKSLDSDVRTDSQNLIYKLICLNCNTEINKDSIELIRGFLSEPVVVIFDGLDEVYHSFSGFISYINDFKSDNPKVQVIISTRDCVSYLGEIDILGITLEPFSKDQLINFIKKYISLEKYNVIKSKLTKTGLSNIINTPLLATVASELFIQGIDTFGNENEIYNSRLRLLTGEYDDIRRIERETNQPIYLQKICIHLAYFMHTSGIRTIEKDLAIEYLRDKTSFSKKLIMELLDDLQYKCNLLFFERTSQEYNFGHFRFQEHLASTALSKTPEFDWYKVLSDDFWRGALVLYAQDNSIEFLIDKLGMQSYNTKNQLETVNAMIKGSNLRSNRGLGDFFDMDIEAYPVLYDDI